MKTEVKQDVPTFLDECYHFKSYIELEITIGSLFEEQKIVTELINFLNSTECRKLGKKISDHVMAIIYFHQKRITKLNAIMNDGITPESN